MYTNRPGVEGAADVLAGTFGDHDDLLGIAHDYGGLVLRDLQLKDDNISAMVLVGVPNQGLPPSISPLLSTPTVMAPLKLLDAIQDFKKGDNCKDCDFTDTF